MNNILERAQRILDDANYIAIPKESDTPYLIFENTTVLGFVLSFETVDRLLNYWRDETDKILKEHSFALSQAGQKAWNVYLVLLAQDSVEEDKLYALQNIEEDLSATRKIVRSGVRTKDDVKAALLPLLPIAYIPSLGALDIKEEIRKRTGDIPPMALDAFLKERETEDIVDLLEGS
jgi:hypothetical protein